MSDKEIYSQRPSLLSSYDQTPELLDTEINSKRHSVLSSLLISENKLRQLNNKMVKYSALQTVKNYIAQGWPSFIKETDISNGIF